MVGDVGWPQQVGPRGLAASWSSTSAAVVVVIHYASLEYISHGPHHSAKKAVGVPATVTVACRVLPPGRMVLIRGPVRPHTRP